MVTPRRRFLTGLGALGAAWPLAGCRVRPGSSCPAAIVQPEAEILAVPDFAELDGFCADSAPIAAAEYEQRFDRLRAELGRRGQAASIVEAGVDMQYLGGPRWGLSERPLLLLVPREGEGVLIGPAFERGTIEARQGPRAFELRVWQEHESPYALVEAALSEARLGDQDVVAVGSATRAFVVDGLRSAAPKRRFDTSEGALAGCRRVKSKAELALLRRVNEATKAALAAAAGHAREGMSEQEFVAIVRAAQQAAGLGDVWVLCLFGPNAAYPHGTPEGRSLHAGDLILVDTGGSLHGYASDITRTWAFPEPAAIDDERRRAWAIVREAQQAGLEIIRPGVRCAEVDAAARRIVAAAGFDPDYGQFTHRLGHGIGMQVHEPPYLVRDGAHVLEPGNTMSVEPGLYLPGAWGIRLEDIVAVTEDGAELFGPAAASIDAPFG